MLCGGEQSCNLAREPVMAVQISLRHPVNLPASCPGTRNRASVYRGVVRHRTRAAHVGWTVLAAGAVAAGAMLGLPVQNVGRTAHMCADQTSLIVGAHAHRVLTGTRQQVIAGVNGEGSIMRRGGSKLACGDSGIDLRVGEF
jgi:hypothetical protein